MEDVVKPTKHLPAPLLAIQRSLGVFVAIAAVTISAQSANADSFFGAEFVPEIGKAIESAACAKSDDPNKLCYASTNSGEIIIYKLPLSDGLEAFKVELRDSCGSAGCATGVFAKMSDQWRLLLEGRALNCLSTKSNGYCDIASFFRDFSSSPPKEMANVFVWNGSSYTRRYTKAAADLPKAAPKSSVAAVARSSSRVGPSFDCAATAVAAQPLPQLICQSDELSRLDLQYVIAYQALRRSLNDQGRKALAADASSFVETTLSQCRIPTKGTLNRSGTPEEISCLRSRYEQQRQILLGRTSGDALEEASLTPEEAISIQKALKAASFLPDSASIDGVIGSTTEDAIAKWQRAVGQRETGFASRTMLSQLTLERSSPIQNAVRAGAQNQLSDGAAAQRIDAELRQSGLLGTWSLECSGAGENKSYEIDPDFGPVVILGWSDGDRSVWTIENFIAGPSGEFDLTYRSIGGRKLVMRQVVQLTGGGLQLVNSWSGNPQRQDVKDRRQTVDDRLLGPSRLCSPDPQRLTAVQRKAFAEQRAENAGQRASRPAEQIAFKCPPTGSVFVYRDIAIGKEKEVLAMRISAGGTGALCLYLSRGPGFGSLEQTAAVAAFWRVVTPNEIVIAKELQPERIWPLTIDSLVTLTPIVDEKGGRRDTTVQVDRRQKLTTAAGDLDTIVVIVREKVTTQTGATEFESSYWWAPSLGETVQAITKNLSAGSQTGWQILNFALANP